MLLLVGVRPGDDLEQGEAGGQGMQWFRAGGRGC